MMDNYKPASVNSVTSSLNTFFDFMKWYDCKLKILKIQRQIFASGDKEITKGEYERLVNTAKKKGDRRLYLLMQTICSTGIRISELCYVDVDAVKMGKAIINCKGKMRQVFLPKQYILTMTLKLILLMKLRKTAW